ncbi:MAG TPA: patatin-like phospholipase family protein [Thermoanaerobaculia bacterium]|jgi:NTE family protein|nr:patatin-like phospholipase family protein [Thermoanaerobaculia bacterium]
MANKGRWSPVAGLAIFLTACATYTPNAALQHYDKSYGYRFSKFAATGNEDETFLILAFSGGGTRAAALAYGVLQELAKTNIKSGTLLDEVDVISSVSGGSFTAAAYALARKMPLDRFERDFLRHDVQGDLVHAALNPRNWLRLLSRRFSRIDLATEYYDEHVFARKTFADLPTRRPYIILNATEMDLGARFEFTQEQFDPICSDLERMKIARAVAASSAFPVLLTAVTLRNYKGCSYEEPQWVANAMEDQFVNPTRFRTAMELRAYADPQRRFLQLIDGGVADNIGLRGPIRALSSNDPGFSVLRLMNRGKVKRVAVIVVNAEKEGGITLDQNEQPPNLAETLSTIANTPMANYSFDTVELLRTDIENWNKDAAIAPDLRPVAFYRTHVTFASLPANERKFFDSLPTSFSLTNGQIDALLKVGARLLHESADFEKLIRDLQ